MPTLPRAALTAALCLSFCGACRQLDAPDWTPPPGRPLIGLMLPLSGANSTLGLALEQGARFAVSEINAQGGVLGQAIDLVEADDRCSSGYGPLAARTLLTSDVVAVIGGACSGPTIAAIDSVFSQLTSPLLVLAPTATSPYLTRLYLSGGNSFFFRVEPSDAKQSQVLADQIQAAGITSVNVMYAGHNPDGSENYYGNRLYQALVGEGGYPSALAAHGIRLVNGGASVVNYQRGATTFTAADMAQLFAGNPQGVVLVAYSDEAAGITRAIRQFQAAQVGRVRLFATDSAYDPTFVANGDSGVSEGIIGTTPAGDPANPDYQKFRAAYEAAAGEPVPTNAETGYDAVYLLAYAAARSGSLTSARMEASIGPITGGTAPDGTPVSNPIPIGVGDYRKALGVLGAGGEIAFAGASGATRIDRNGDPSVGTYLIWTVVGGKLTKVATVTQ